MELEIINRVSKVIKDQKTTSRSVATIKIDSNKGILFSAETVRLFGMEKGKYVHFGREGKYWYFVVNTINTGFIINITNPSKPHISGARIWSAGLVKLLTTSTKRKEGDTFYVQKTESEHKGCPVIEILTHKTVKEINS